MSNFSMTGIFISHTKENAPCAEQLQQGLEAEGYRVWGEPSAMSPQSPLYIHTIENNILRSAAVILVWSSSAAQSQLTMQQLLFAQSLKKPLFLVVLDETLLPDTVVTVQSIQSEASCMNAIAQLLPILPSSHSQDEFIALSEQAVHEFIRVRRDAIQVSSEMLKQGKHREEILVLLGYLAHSDSIMNVREEAQAVIDANTKKAQPWRPDDARHIFGVKCSNGHVCYFDKRVACTAYRPGVRGTSASTLDELHLKCKICNIEVVDKQDCRDYK
jgi:hypothetical protein